MSTLYYGELFFGIKFFIKDTESGIENDLFHGKHQLTEAAVEKGLDIFVRSLKDRLNYNKDEIFVVIGRRLAMAGYDMDFFKEVDHRQFAEVMKTVGSELKSLQFKEEPSFYLVTSDI